MTSPFGRIVWSGAAAAAFTFAVAGLALGQSAPPSLFPEAQQGAAADAPGAVEQRPIEGGAVVIDPRTGLPRYLNAPPPEEESDRRARARLRAEAARLEALENGEGLEDGAAAAGIERRDDLDLDGLGADALRPGAPIPEAAPPPAVPGERVVLRGLDKLSGELGEVEAVVGETAALWRLEIDVKSCYARPEAGSTDAYAFLQIRDTKPEVAETVFSGWMLAASPALSAMDHPRYDVWVLSCSVSSSETSG